MVAIIASLTLAALVVAGAVYLAVLQSQTTKSMAATLARVAYLTQVPGYLVVQGKEGPPQHYKLDTAKGATETLTTAPDIDMAPLEDMVPIGDERIG
jgi:hypothetical protein